MVKGRSKAILKPPARVHAGKEPWRVVAVGDSLLSEQGMAAIVVRDERYRAFAEAPTVSVRLEPVNGNNFTTAIRARYATI